MLLSAFAVAGRGACAQSEGPASSAIRPLDQQRISSTPAYITRHGGEAFLDLDAYVEHQAGAAFPAAMVESVKVPPLGSGWLDAPFALPEPGLLDESWHWQLFPQGLIYRSYLAGTKEPRLGAHVLNLRDQGGVFEGILGTRVGLLRFGTLDAFWPTGWQIDLEGAAHVRMDLPDDVEVQAVDFRAGLPITFGRGSHRTKFAYYHLSSHLGDEYMLKNPTAQRVNYSRDVLVLGHSVYTWSNQLRVYGETGWAFYGDVSKPWEFQFGLDFAPPGPTGLGGAPFWAINAHLRQDVNFGGAVTVEAGWAWRGGQHAGMLRAGLIYYNGESNQFSFFDEHEEQIGFGLWYDS